MPVTSGSTHHKTGSEHQGLTKGQLGYLIRITLIATLGGLLFGYDTGVISGAIGPITDYFQLAPAEKGWAVSSVVIGCIGGAICAGWVSIRFGRRMAFLIAAILFFLSAIGSATATDFTVYSIWRVIGGMAVGLASVVAPMYISEMSPGHLRGRTVSLFQQSIVFGQMVVFFVNYFIAKGMAEAWIIEHGWRWMLGSEALPALLFAILLMFIPESPRWLVLRGRHEQARGVLAKFTPATRVESTLKEIVSSYRDATLENRISLKERGLLGLVVLGSFLACAQQLTGINVVMYYAPEVLSTVTSSSEDALLQTSIMGVTFVGGNLLGMLLIDKVGRRPLLIAGSIGSMIGMCALGLIISRDAIGYGALLALIVYVVSFAVSWGCVCWTLLSEIFPNAIRGRAMAIALAAQWFMGFVVTQSFPMLRQSEFLNSAFGTGFSFWLYAVLILLSMLIVMRYVPETKGKTLEELEDITGTRLSKRRRELASANASS
ncbi:sugar porter family MFS transporter [Cobetia sp. 29-18-1]|uniref:sugar porter family MFS transporter n=1 Tax=Cobetia sp. 29-18-1 TaxID=3040018 RepID=UPI002447C003|nr:sugar porter family MFS transporter [Cobetia sp. 29-18-1]MDH2298392.1 sugar porter family MFS transporter [Cobetia sp. 29-18-1]